METTKPQATLILYPAKKWFSHKESEVLLAGNPPTYYELASKRGASLLAFWVLQEEIDKDDKVLPCTQREMELLETLSPSNYT